MSFAGIRPRPLVALAALAAAGLACSGAIEGGSGGKPGSGGSPSSPGGRPGNATPGPGGGAVPDPGTGTVLPPIGTNPMAPERTGVCKDVSPGPSPVRRLTRVEYDNTVRDLLGEPLPLARDFPPEELQNSFDNNAELRSVSDRLAQAYVGAAEQVAQAVKGKLSTLLACDPAKDGEGACLDRFLDGFGTRAWRRPLEAGEKDDLRKVFADNKAGGFADGIDAVVQVMVLSPQFTYRLERGVPVSGSSYSRLTHWEMASRLSYLLWGTMPDPALLDAARAGKLGTRDEVMAQATRMLADPRATAMVTNFAGQWLQLRELAEADKDTDAYPNFKDEHLDLFRQETEGFVAEVWKTDAKLDSLLSAPFSLVNAELATLYGVKGVTGAELRKVDLDPAQRAGVLTQLSILAAKAGPDQSSPIHRGVFVREQMFCQELPPPPPEANAEPPKLDPKMTTKERFAAHRNDPNCASCHNLIDSVGFGFEQYDGLGQWRTVENGKPVDATGELMNTDVDGKFNGAIELGKKLVASKAVEGCMATHMFQFSFGRGSTAADKCTVETLGKTFAESQGSLRDMLMALVQSDAFFFKGGL
jgi:hypothetical protein